MSSLLFAVPTAEGRVCLHFGHCEQFTFVRVEEGRVVDISTKVPPPHEPGVLPAWLHELGVTHILAGGMGQRAQNLFRQKGIVVVTGVDHGRPAPVVEQYLAGCLTTGENLCDH